MIEAVHTARSTLVPQPLPRTAVALRILAAQVVRRACEVPTSIRINVHRLTAHTLSGGGLTMDSPDAVLHELSRSLTPLSADFNDEVNRLSTAPVTPKFDLANYHVDEESDLSPLTSSDEEQEEPLHPISSGRTLRPRISRLSALTAECSTSSPETMSLPSTPPPVDRPSRASRKRKRSESPTAKTTFVAQEQKHRPGPHVSEDRCHQCRNQPRYAFMRCTSHNESDRACRKLFCVSCVIKRSVSFPNFYI